MESIKKDLYEKVLKRAERLYNIYQSWNTNGLDNPVNFDRLPAAEKNTWLMVAMGKKKDDDKKKKKGKKLESDVPTIKI